MSNELKADRAVRAVKPAAKRKPVAAKRKPVNELKAWAYAGVGITLLLSGWLNGMAFAEYAPVASYGWRLGVAIPVLILVFSRVSALLYGCGRKWEGRAGMVACLSILLLSVQHCAVSISRLTGEHVGLAALMALAIDAGLVVCELATLKVSK